MAYSKSTIPAVSVPTESTWNGHHLIILPNPDDITKSGVQFGVKKAKAFLEHVPAVQAFVDKHAAKSDATAEAAKLVAANAKTAALVAKLRALKVSDEEIAKITG